MFFKTDRPRAAKMNLRVAVCPKTIPGLFLNKIPIFFKYYIYIAAITIKKF